MVRSSLVLGGVALALLIFIVVYERGTVSTTEREQRSGRVLDRLVRERLSKVTIQRKGVTTVLTRGRDEKNDLDLGQWQVAAPFASIADQEAVDTLLGELEWLMGRRTLTGVKPEDIARFGLDKPRYRVTFTVGRDVSTFIVGKDSPQGDGTYVQASDPTVAYVVGKDLVESLDHDPEHFHTKELHDGLSMFSLHKLVLRDGSGERVIEKRGDYFWLTKPEAGLASEPAINAAIDGIDTLKATRFIATRPASGSDYGFQSPSFVAEATSLHVSSAGKDANKAQKATEKTLRLVVGAACAPHANESYLRVDDGPVMCANDADIDKAKKDAASLFESRLLILDDTQTLGVRVRSGKTELVLREDENGWTYELSEAGKAKTTAPADDAAVSDWFKQLRSAQVLSHQAGGAMLRDVGLDTPVLTIAFERGKDKAAFDVRFGHGSQGRVPAQRIDDGALLYFPQAVLSLVEPSTSRFRKLKLVDEAEGTFTKLSVTRASGPREEVTKTAGGFVLAGPAKAAVERSTVDEIVRLFSQLEVLRFVADEPSAEHGLASPFAVLTLEYAGKAGPKRYSLKLGAQTEGGRFAQLAGDTAVFVVADVLASLVDAPLVDCSALATPLEQLVSFEVVRAGKSVRVEGSAGGGWVVLGGSSPEPSRAEALARAVATLRASRVSTYGKAKPEEGLSRPVAELRIKSRAASGEAVHSLLIGAPVSAEQGAAHYARRSDLDVGFELPAEQVDALLEVPQAPEPAEAPAP